MRINLKKVLLCGISLFAALMFMLAFVTNFNVINPQTEAVLSKGSLWSNLSHHKFDVALNLKIAAYAAQGEGSAKSLTSEQNIFKIFAIIGLVAVLGMFVVSLLAMLPKTNKGARKLLIPLFSIFAITAFVAIVSPISGLRFGMHGVQYLEPKAFPVILFWLIGAVCFIAAIIVSGVVKDKDLIKSKK